MPCAKSIGIMSWPKFVSGVATPLPAMVGSKMATRHLSVRKLRSLSSRYSAWETKQATCLKPPYWTQRDNQCRAISFIFGMELS